MRRCPSGVINWGLHTGAGQPVNEEVDGMQLIPLQESKEDELAEVPSTGHGTCSSQ